MFIFLGDVEENKRGCFIDSQCI